MLPASFRFACPVALALALAATSTVAQAQPEPEDYEGEAEPSDDDAPGAETPEPGADQALDGTATGDEAPATEDTDDEPAEALAGAADEDDEEWSDDEFGDDDGGDDIEIEWSGRIQSDLRFRVDKQSVGGWYATQELPVGIDRNENIAGLRFQARYGDVSGVADLDFVLYGFAQDIEGIDDLSRREKTDPYRFEAHRLYVKVEDLFAPGFELRVGQQLILWGVGDQFNPTNNLNADDVEDVLLFGEQQGNFMVRADYWVDEDWSITGVLVPIFKPALLPRSGALALAMPDRIPIEDEYVRHRLHTELGAARVLANHPTVVREIGIELPEANLENMQASYRIGGTIAEQDVAFSYYRGRTDFPVPKRNHNTQDSTAACNPDDPTDCIDGTIDTAVTLHYPEMHVYGFNMAGELPTDKIADFLSAIGYRLEAALIVPTRAEMEIQMGDLDIAGFQIPAGEYDYNGRDDGIGPRPVVVNDTPFAKWAVGLDYTFFENLYANLQWVHGLPDEYGAGDWITEGYAVRAGGVVEDDAAIINCAIVDVDGTQCAVETLRPRIADYLVTGIDIRLLKQKLLVRLFTILDLSGVWTVQYDAVAGQRVKDFHGPFSDEGFGAIVYPEVNYNFGNGLDLGAGALFQIGKEHGKFGDPATGGSVAWARTRFNF
ncbi:MAG: hypothetical protein JRI68_03875 [Deltaproteobacteria bacterium]|nr:hypothetical protein [Deltaproteobacteria bacterium]